MMVCGRCGTRFPLIQTELQIVVNAPMEKVYSVNADYAHWPQHFPQFKSVRLISERRNERWLETMVTNRKGKTRSVKEVQRLVSPDRIEEEVYLRTRSNLVVTTLTERIIRTYEKTQEGTRASVTVFLLPGRYGLFSAYRLVKGRLERQINASYRKQLEIIKQAAEAA
jgi:hypothetical protein